MCILLMDAKNAIRMEVGLNTAGTARTEPNAVTYTGSSEGMMLTKLKLLVAPNPGALTSGPQVIATTMSLYDTNGHRLQSANHDTVLKGT